MTQTTTATPSRTVPQPAVPHPQRKEIARYLLARGLDPGTMAPSADQLDVAASAASTIAFPDGLAPVFVPVDPNRAPSSSLPKADVVVITWTVDELAGLAKVFCPGHSASKWARYTHRYPTFATQIRKGAPAANSKRLASFQPVTVGGLKVLCMKSELHLNQDGVKTGEGTATLPVKDLFKQIITETEPLAHPHDRHRRQRVRRLSARRRRGHPCRQVPPPAGVPQRAVQRPDLPERLGAPHVPPRRRRNS